MSLSLCSVFMVTGCGNNSGEVDDSKLSVYEWHEYDVDNKHTEDMILKYNEDGSLAYAEYYWVRDNATSCDYANKVYNESEDKTPKWLAVAKDFIFASYDDYAYCARIYDTANPAGYADQGILISRAIETEYGGEFTKSLVRRFVQFEMNNLTDDNGTIDIYVCWNREWNSIDDSAWVHIAQITQDDADFGEESSGWWYSVGTCVHRFENAWDWKFLQDRQVIEYKVVITRWSEENASPVLRSLLFNYNVKEKTNFF